ncbi:MAG: aldehyde ferredoxin oxidoreductase family protein [Actinomycetota bacterium]|nr:aldehyde ferredoxin oxidoreductase family protein [Actinomycetota bacterium]
MHMAFGNMGKVLEVDLSTGSTQEIEIPEQTYRDYIGGAGLAARLLFERGNLEAGALDPDNLLIFAAGPLTGIGFSGSSRLSVGARSPLTGIWGQASCGGNFGPELKRCGYDAVILKGKAASPVFLLLGEDSADLLPADDLWGMDTYETTDILKERYGKGAKVLAIGPAGENLIPFASIANDYGHHFGRAGMGAVMGSKQLKAIVAEGNKKMEFADPEKVKAMQEEHREMIKDNIFCGALSAFGTGANMEAKMFEGDVPTRNWGRGLWEEGAEKLSGIALADNFVVDHASCRGCAVRCKPVVEVKEGPYAMARPGPGPEYETQAAFGTLIMNDNLAALCKINDFCNRVGIDTITMGATFAWAMDCFEVGILKPEEYDGMKLEWGDVDAVIELLPSVVARQGRLASLLAKGSRAAAEEVGGGAEAYLTDSKGLEAPMHDPRCNWGDGLAYAVSIRGACHVSNLTFLLEWGAVEYPEIGLDKNYMPQSAEYKAEAAALTADLGCIMNSACWCEFPGTAYSVTQWAELFNAVAGYGWDVAKMMEAGARVWFLQRCLGHIWGATGADDRIGQRIMTPVEDGGIAGSVPDMDTMLREFYEYRGMTPDGIPTRETLEKYGLGDVANHL